MILETILNENSEFYFLKTGVASRISDAYAQNSG